jgi:hypothetical protein
MRFFNLFFYSKLHSCETKAIGCVKVRNVAIVKKLMQGAWMLWAALAMAIIQSLSNQSRLTTNNNVNHKQAMKTRVKWIIRPSRRACIYLIFLASQHECHALPLLCCPSTTAIIWHKANVEGQNATAGCQNPKNKNRRSCIALAGTAQCEEICYWHIGNSMGVNIVASNA